MFRKEKSINAILYILQNEGGSCDMHKICKILYFADQKHLSEYGRLITGDVYIAMQYGPVPSKIYDIFKAVRGDSYFSGDEFKTQFCFINKKDVEGKVKPNTEELSESDIECIDYAIAQCKGKDFEELTQMSHSYAWSNTAKDRNISYKDILREIGDNEGYVEYISQKLQTDKLLSL